MPSCTVLDMLTRPSEYVVGHTFPCAFPSASVASGNSPSSGSDFGFRSAPVSVFPTRSFDRSPNRAQLCLFTASTTCSFCTSITGAFMCLSPYFLSPSICTCLNAFGAIFSSTCIAFLPLPSLIGCAIVPLPPWSTRVSPFYPVCCIGGVLALCDGVSPCSFTPLHIASGFQLVSKSSYGRGLLAPTIRLCTSLPSVSCVRWPSCI